MLKNGRDGKDCVFADVCMSVLKARSGRGEERFDELGLSKFGKEAKSIASDIFIRML